MRCLLITSVAALLATGCAQTPESNQATEVQKVGEQLSAGSALAIQSYLEVAPTKRIGEDCMKGGGVECRDGICLRAGASADSHVCTRRCVSTEACPSEWTCEAIGPRVQGASQFCLPPATWSYSVAEERKEEGSAP
jgi:hypothetical protein